MGSWSERVDLSIAGYSWKMNQYGLTIDMIMVTQASDPNLFFDLKVRVVNAVNM